MNLPTWSPIQPSRTGRERGGDGGGMVARRGETAGPAGLGEENRNLPHPLLSDLPLGGGLAMSGPLHGCGWAVQRFTRLSNAVICCTKSLKNCYKHAVYMTNGERCILLAILLQRARFSSLPQHCYQTGSLPVFNTRLQIRFWLRSFCLTFCSYVQT